MPQLIPIFRKITQINAENELNLLFIFTEKTAFGGLKSVVKKTAE